MRATFTTVFLLMFAIMLFGQPSNDDCANAINLNLGTPAPCPNTSSVTNNFTFSNINATPVVPYPALTGCSVGGSLDAPAAEVWFTFTATANTITAAVAGLNSPNVALFQGADCGFLTPIDCASSAPGGGSITMTTAPMFIGQTYFLMVSGGDVNDQGNFDLIMSSNNQCDPCFGGASFNAAPPPINGTWSADQVVNFCFTIESWESQSSIEWPHAIEIDFGPGWDLSTLAAIPPPSCDGAGFWGYYDSWTSCNTGSTFGPGFAYESSLGVGCGGTPFDGNPGNNWGDGANGCAGAGFQPITFCWQVQVATCPPTTTGTALNSKCYRLV